MSGQHQNLHVAAAQYSFDELESLDQWQSKIATWVAEGSNSGQQLLVFPEYGATEQAAIFGGEVSQDLRQTRSKVGELSQERIDFHITLAKQYNVHILVGSGPVQDKKGLYYNAAQLVTPTGAVGEQRKLILTPFERQWGLTPGTEPIVFDTVLGRIGIAICYDCEFPLLVRAMAVAGAQMVLVPACTEGLSGQTRVRTAGRARAIENRLAVVHAVTVGEAAWSPVVDRNTGSAGIYVPAVTEYREDGVLVKGDQNVPGWVSAHIDFARLKDCRSNAEVRNFDDWERQPGGQNSSLPQAKVVSLR